MSCGKGAGWQARWAGVLAVAFVGLSLLSILAFVVLSECAWVARGKPQIEAVYDAAKHCCVVLAFSGGIGAFVIVLVKYSPPD